MAEYNTNSDFSTDAANTVAHGTAVSTITGWTHISPTGSFSSLRNTTITEEAGAIGGKYAAMDDTGYGSTFHLVEFDAPGTIADNTETDWLFRFRVSDAFGAERRVGVFRNVSGDCYGLRLFTSGNVQLAEMAGTSVWSNVGSSVAKSLAADTWYWARVRVTVDGEWSWRVWSGDIGDEPAGWDVGDGGSGGVTSTRTVGGTAGITMIASAALLDYDWFSVGTAGDPAPSPAADPTLTDLDTDEIVAEGQTGATFTCGDAGADETERTLTLIQGAVSVTQTQQTGDSSGGTFDVVLGGLKFGPITARVTRTSDSTFGELAGSIIPASGQEFVNLSSVNGTSANRITATPDLEVGDQLHARGEGGGAAPTGLSLNADGTFEFSSGNTPADFDVRVWDVNDATWGAWTTQSVGAELVVASAVHGQTADNVELTQSHVLGVQSASHGHTAESLDLSQAVDLNVDDSLHSQAADPVSLTQAHSLAVNESAHAQVADNIALTQAHALAVGSAAHAQTADSVALTQQHLLAVQSAVHDQAAESITLQVAGALEVQSALHGQAADNVGLTQAHQLGVDDASHAQAADTIDLSTGLILAVADALHQHGVDNVTLSQAHILAIAEALHAHAAANITLQQGNVMDVDDALHAHAADAVVLTVGNLLAVASAVHVQQADAISFTQAHTLVVSSALHQHLADHISLRIPGFVNKPGRVFVVEAKNRTFVVARGNRTFHA